MSTRKDGRPPRPPPPRQGSTGRLSTGGLGISFKSLEEEDEDDLTIFTGKFDKVVEENKIQKATERGSIRVTAESTLSKHHSSAPSLDELDRSSPTKKNRSSVFEYREILSGIKDKITDTKEKITDTIQKKLEISGDSSSNTSPEKETVEIVVKEDKTPDEFIKVESLDPFLKDEIMEEKASLLRGEIGLKHEAVPETDPLLKPPSDNGLFDDELDDLQDDDVDDIEVIDEYYGNEPMEDFTGVPSISMSVKRRSKFKRLGKKKLHTSATVAMSRLVDSSPTNEENCASANIFDSDSDNIAPPCPTTKPDSPSTTEDTTRHIPVQKMAAIVMCLFAYYIIPLPDYLSGFVLGCLFVSSAMLLYAWLYRPPKPREPFSLPLLEELPSMQLPVMKEPVAESGIFKVCNHYIYGL